MVIVVYKLWSPSRSQKKMKIYPRVAVALAVFGLSSAVTRTDPATAAILNYDFTLNSSEQTFGSGSFSYDTSQKQDPSFPPLALPPKLTDFKVSFLDKTYTNVEFVNRSTVVSSIQTNPDTGELVSDKLVVPFPNCSVACQPALVLDNNSFTAFADPKSSPAATGSVTYVDPPSGSTPVPEPDFTVGLSVLSFGLLMKKTLERVSRRPSSTARVLTNKVH